MKFIGREAELKQLRTFKKKKTASFIVIRGRRRIGKSRLVEEFAKDFPKSYIFSGLPPQKEVTEAIQRQEFITQMQQQQIPRFGSDSWSDLFFDLAKYCSSGPVLIALDEITWMGSKDPAFLGKLKNAWDLHFKKNSELVLVISGSDSGWIEKNILSSTGFVGRISYRLKLEELPLAACRQFFLPTASDYEVFKVLSVTGGIPRYLEEIQPELTPEKNICDLCFDEGGLLFNEFNQIFSTLFSDRVNTYTNILLSLVNGSKSIKEIALFLQRSPGGDLSQDLDNLIQSGFVQRIRKWQLIDPKKGELYHYRISDNYTRFYLKFVSPIHEQIKQARLIEPPPGWHSILGLQFESLVVQHHKELIHLLNIPFNEIIASGPYFQNKTTKHDACQIDHLVQTKYDSLYLCEIKFSKKELGVEVIAEVMEKEKKLARPKGMSIRPVLVHVNGVTDALLYSQYFAHVINFSDLLIPPT